MNTGDKLKKSIYDWDRSYLEGRLWLLRNAPSFQSYQKVRQMTKRPILIGGCGRSGTTLLLSLLSVHPNIYAIPKETCAFCWAYYPDGPSPPPIFRIHRIYRRLLQSSDLEDQQRWAEKTPKNVQSIGRLLDYFGDGLRFLNIVRDGRDVVTSRHPVDEKGYWVPPKRWVNDVSAGVAYEDHEQVLTIKYENITEDYMSVMRSVCNFLDEPFHNKRFSKYPETSAFNSSIAWSTTAKNVHQGSVHRWKKPEHKEVVDELLNIKRANDILKHYKYT